MIHDREIKFRGDGVAHFSIYGPDTGKSYLTIQNTSANAAPGTVGTDLLTITSGGNVGIGTTAPTQKLEVVGKALINGAVMVGGAQPGVGGDVAPMIDLGVGTTREANAYKITRDVWATGLNIVGGPGAGGFDRRIHMWDNVDIKGNAFVAGNVGIGTTNPGIHRVVSRINPTGAGEFQFYADSPDGPWTGLRADSVVGSHTPLAQNGDSALIFSGGAVDTGGLVIAQWSQYPRGIRIDSSGNVGIGTTAPGARLEVFNTAASGHLILSANDNWAADLTRVDIDFKVANTGHTVGRIASFYTDSAGGGYGGLRFYTRNAGSLGEVMRLTPSGNVGIGTTTPGYKLDVVGDIRTSGKYWVGGSAGATQNYSYCQWGSCGNCFTIEVVGGIVRNFYTYITPCLP
jgi:hypothetical protein